MPPVVGFVGPSGSGKTTLITRVLPVLRAEGLRVAVLKHAHCEVLVVAFPDGVFEEA